MSAPFRIRRRDTRAEAAATARLAAPVAMDGFSSYLDRLLKMIPAEVISLYLVGSGLIPGDQSTVLVIWGLICLAGVVVIRAYGTADVQNALPTDWVHVAISSIAFVIWVYSMGGPFRVYDLYQSTLGSLLVLAWTFFVPVFYKGPKD